MAFGKKNVVKTDPFCYNIGLLGEGGIGKTTLIYKMCRKHLGDDGYLFVECGKEDGADAISGINYINCPDWNSEYDELNNSVGFKLLIEDILENKDTDYPNLRVLAVDTYDQLREIVEPEVIRRHNKQHPDKRVTSVKAAFGGYNAGDDMCDDIILDLLWELKKVGVQFIIIGHVKQRDVTDIYSGESYTTLTTDMSMRSFNKMRTKLHFLGLASIDREIVKLQKSDKDKKAKGKVQSETRRITFRDDNYAIDSKSRFADIAGECEMNEDALYQTLVDAIEAEAARGEGGLKASEKEQKAFDAGRAKKASEYQEALKEAHVDSNRNAELVADIKAKFKDCKDADIKAAVKKIIKDNECKSFDDLADLPTTILEEIASLLA